MSEYYFRETEDVFLAATLYALGFDLRYMDASRGKYYFGFSATDEVIDAMEKYPDGKVLVEPQKLFQSYGLLKLKMYE